MSYRLQDDRIHDVDDLGWRDDMVECDGCELLIQNDNAFETCNGRLFCESCSDKHAETCTCRAELK